MLSTIRIVFSIYQCKHSVVQRYLFCEYLSYVLKCCYRYRRKKKIRRETSPLEVTERGQSKGGEEAKCHAGKVDHVESHEVRQGVLTFFEWQC